MIRCLSWALWRGPRGQIQSPTITQNLNAPSPTYLGSGKLGELEDTVKELHVETVIFDDELTPAQQRVLEDRLQVKVIDRTALILDIFAGRARTREKASCRLNWRRSSI